MRFLLDTNVITEVAKPRPNARVLNWLLAHEAASGIPSMAVAERYHGAHNAPKELRVRLLSEVDRFAGTKSALPTLTEFFARRSRAIRFRPRPSLIISKVPTKRPIKRND